MEPHKIDSYDISLRKIGERLDAMQKSSQIDSKRNLIISSIAAIASVVAAIAAVISLF